MELKLVKCNRCAHWIDEQRFKEICQHCNNTGKTLDPSAILCNRCGECMRPLGTHNEQYPHGLEDTVVTGGYDSYHLSDGTAYKFSICEKCLRELFNQFKIKPVVTDYFDGESCGWEVDQKFYEYRVWKDEGNHHKAYTEGMCNFIKNCPNQAVYTQFINDEFTEGCCCEEHKELWQYTNSKLVPFISNILKPFL